MRLNFEDIDLQDRSYYVKLLINICFLNNIRYDYDDDNYFYIREDKNKRYNKWMDPLLFVSYNLGKKIYKKQESFKIKKEYFY
jgi:hypothetical protein